MKEQQIKWLEKSPRLCQAINTGVEFAFANDQNEQATVFCHCKDYLQDAIWGFIHGKKVSVYGFSYDPKTEPSLTMKKTRLLLVNRGDKQMDDKIKAAQDFLNQFEASIGFSKTLVFRVSNPKPQHVQCGCWLFEASSRWLKAPPMISLYTLLVRVAFNHTLGKSFETTIHQVRHGGTTPYSSPADSSQLKQAEKGIKKLREMGDRKVFSWRLKDNYPSGIKTMELHNNHGIVGYSSRFTKISHWQPIA